MIYSQGHQQQLVEYRIYNMVSGVGCSNILNPLQQFCIYHCGYMHRCTMIASTRMDFKIPHKFIQQKISDSSSLCLRKENRKISEASCLCCFFFLSSSHMLELSGGSSVEKMALSRLLTGNFSQGIS